MASANPPSDLDKPRHIRYWQRCHRSLLPIYYTPQDSIRLTLTFFIISALDLLSGPSSSSSSPNPPLLTPADRKSIRSFVLSLRHPAGGFVGSPNHLLPIPCYLGLKPGGGGEFGVASSSSSSSSSPHHHHHHHNRHPHAHDANLAATSFALLLLALAAEDDESARAAFAHVDRKATLRWLRRLQRDDGSFGEVVDSDGRVQGGRDMRCCYLAASVRWCLRGDVEEGDEEWVEDIDVDGLIRHVRQAQTYDGGMAESSQHESHAGYAYCGVAALSLLERPLAESSSRPRPALHAGIPNMPALVKFLACRQFAYIESASSSDDDGDEEEDPETGNYVAGLPGSLPCDANDLCVGYNGRWNKNADTCYCWWVGGTLQILGHLDLVNKPASRRFITSKTQHNIGGFSKYPGGPPDVYHAYLGLAALALLDESSTPEGRALKEFDAELCASLDTVRKIEKARAGLLGR